MTQQITMKIQFPCEESTADNRRMGLMISAQQCCQSVPIIAAYQCSIISASSSAQPISAAYHATSSVLPISAASSMHIRDICTDHQGTDQRHHQCSSMPLASAHQCHINATYQC
ncbi:unnamed protein product, partial [Staurois parvus]